MRLRRAMGVLSLLAVTALTASAQSPVNLGTGPNDADMREKAGRLVLVLPFDNRSGQTALNWIGDSFPDTLNQRLNSAGFLTITRDDRLFALEHLGFPNDFRPTRATTLRVAQTLDADYIVVGSYTVKDNQIAVQAQVLEVNRLKMSAPLGITADLDKLLTVENSLAWRVARQMDPKFAVAEQTFQSAAAGVKLSSFENYIRGTDAATPQERIKRLQLSVTDTPTYSAALLALGKNQYADRQYEAAAATLAKVSATNREALEANFFRGLALFNQTKYADAESSFAMVASRLPLPEVVNNQGVAASRQGKNAAPLFQRASSVDPNDEDYHFNLAIALWRSGDVPGATREVDAALRLKKTDNEAIELRAHLNSRPPAASATANPGAGFDPQPRIRRTYSEASFRQAAFQMDQIRSLRIATLPPQQQAEAYTQSGRDYMVQGLVPEAESEFLLAIAANRNDSAAHAGLAQVREQSGNAEDARNEANLSIQLKPNAAAYLILARIDLAANQLGACASDVGNALRLEPGNSAAMGMKLALAQRNQSIP